MRVLIIDDELSIRAMTAVALETMGHQTAAAEDADAALRQLAAEHFDAAFLDLRLADQNGLELLPRLLQSQPGLGVIIFSGSATPADTTAARNAGAAGFMEKPFTPDQVRQALVNLPHAHVAAPVE